VVVVVVGGDGVLMSERKKNEGFMGVKERAVVAQKIPTVSLFLEDFQTSHF